MSWLENLKNGPEHNDNKLLSKLLEFLINDNKDEFKNEFNKLKNGGQNPINITCWFCPPNQQLLDETIKIKNSIFTFNCLFYIFNNLNYYLGTCTEKGEDDLFYIPLSLLAFSTLFNNYEIAEFLIEEEANIDGMLYEGKANINTYSTPISLTFDTKMLELLMINGADINKMGTGGSTLLSNCLLLFSGARSEIPLYEWTKKNLSYITNYILEVLNKGANPNYPYYCLFPLNIIFNSIFSAQTNNELFFQLAIKITMFLIYFGVNTNNRPFEIYNEDKIYNSVVSLPIWNTWAYGIRQFGEKNIDLLSLRGFKSFKNIFEDKWEVIIDFLKKENPIPENKDEADELFWSFKTTFLTVFEESYYIGDLLFDENTLTIVKFPIDKEDSEEYNYLDIITKVESNLKEFFNKLVNVFKDLTNSKKSEEIREFINTQIFPNFREVFSREYLRLFIRVLSLNVKEVLTSCKDFTKKDAPHVLKLLEKIARAYQIPVGENLTDEDIKRICECSNFVRENINEEINDKVILQRKKRRKNKCSGNEFKDDFLNFPESEILSYEDEGWSKNSSGEWEQQSKEYCFHMSEIINILKNRVNPELYIDPPVDIGTGDYFAGTNKEIPKEVLKRFWQEFKIFANLDLLEVNETDNMFYDDKFYNLGSSDKIEQRKGFFPLYQSPTPFPIQFLEKPSIGGTEIEEKMVRYSPTLNFKLGFLEGILNESDQYLHFIQIIDKLPTVFFREFFWLLDPVYTNWFDYFDEFAISQCGPKDDVFICDKVRIVLLEFLTDFLMMGLSSNFYTKSKVRMGGQLIPTAHVVPTLNIFGLPWLGSILKQIESNFDRILNIKDFFDNLNPDDTDRVTTFNNLLESRYENEGIMMNLVQLFVHGEGAHQHIIGQEYTNWEMLKNNLDVLELKPEDLSQFLNLLSTPKEIKEIQDYETWVSQEDNLNKSLEDYEKEYLFLRLSDLKRIPEVRENPQNVWNQLMVENDIENVISYIKENEEQIAEEELQNVRVQIMNSITDFISSNPRVWYNDKGVMERGLFPNEYVDLKKKFERKRN